MTLRFEGIPQKFVDIHRKQIQASLPRDPGFAEVVRVQPREPLGVVGDIDQFATITLVELLASYDLKRQAWLVELLPGSEAVILDWELRHKDTTREEFDWLPFAKESA